MKQNSTKWKIKIKGQTKKFNSNFILWNNIYNIFTRRQNMLPKTQLIEKTVDNLQDYLGPQNCHEYYVPQFRMVRLI